MKSPFSLILAMGLAACCALSSSCQAFTKQNAADIGSQLAKSSLDLAAKELAGEPVNLKAELAQMGLQVASNAIAKVTYNLSAPESVAPATVVSSAASIAQTQISAAAVDDPQIQARASEHAASAAVIAQTRLSTSPPAGADVATSGK
ncbi:hypothetical protein [Prosthecobacter sp.]|uniref:hypothetical protein n=1 Tax=Prosthecobacter sp. TaxID=1965333 RepID=UPI003784F869